MTHIARTDPAPSASLLEETEELDPYWIEEPFAERASGLTAWRELMR
ncbi:hypothetical protein [Brachybacterium sp. J153]|nr:hypothetical protein [Brachybacterium sp. J153]MEE1619315.1 hypothetical protein [Brachybacterium sp. J153]